MSSACLFLRKQVQGWMVIFWNRYWWKPTGMWLERGYMAGPACYLAVLKSIQIVATCAAHFPCPYCLDASIRPLYRPFAANFTVGVVYTRTFTSSSRSFPRLYNNWFRKRHIRSTWRFLFKYSRDVNHYEAGNVDSLTPLRLIRYPLTCKIALWKAAGASKAGMPGAFELWESI